jgi:hypothetical protein
MGGRFLDNNTVAVRGIVPSVLGFHFYYGSLGFKFNPCVASVKIDVPGITLVKI